jgi:hypothetical protein
LGEIIFNVYIAVGACFALYMAVTEDGFEPGFAGVMMMVFMVFLGPLVLMWTGISSLLESSSSHSKPSTPAKPKKTDDELIKDYKDSIDTLSPVFCIESPPIDIKITKSHIANAQKLGALSRKLVVKPHLNKILVTQILNAALLQVDKAYPNDTATAVTRKAAIKEHLSKINGATRKKKQAPADKPTGTPKKKSSGQGAKKKEPKSKSIGFDLSDIGNKASQSKATKKTDVTEEKESQITKVGKEKKKLSVTVNYD